MSEPVGTRYAFLDLLKFIGLIFIIARHTVLCSGQPLTLGSLTFGMQHANLAVEFFFLLCGFFLATHLRRHPQEDTLIYLKNRYRRFLPVHAVCLLLILLCMLRFNLSTLPAFLHQNPDFFLELLLVHHLGFSTFEINNPSWFLCALLPASLLTHALLCAALRRGSAKYCGAPFALIIMLSLTVILSTTGHLGVSRGPLWHLTDLGVLRATAEVMLGTLIAIYLTPAPRTDSSTTLSSQTSTSSWRSHLSERHLKLLSTTLATAAELVMLSVFGYVLLLPAPSVAADLMLLLAFAAIITLSLHTHGRGLIGALCATKPLRLLFETELSLYLCHWLFTSHYADVAILLPDFLKERSFASITLLSLLLSALLTALIPTCRSSYRADHKSPPPPHLIALITNRSYESFTLKLCPAPISPHPQLHSLTLAEPPL